MILSNQEIATYSSVLGKGVTQEQAEPAVHEMLTHPLQAHHHKDLKGIAPFERCHETHERGQELKLKSAKGIILKKQCLEF